MYYKCRRNSLLRIDPDPDQEYTYIFYIVGIASFGLLHTFYITLTNLVYHFTVRVTGLNLRTVYVRLYGGMYVFLVHAPTAI